MFTKDVSLKFYCVVFFSALISRVMLVSELVLEVALCLVFWLRIGLTFFSLVESTANSPDPGFFFDRMMFITKTCYSLPVC